MKKKPLLLLLTGVVAIGFWYLNTRKPESPEYLTVQIDKGDITQIVTSTGTLRPLLNVTVGCQISGTISNLDADFNSIVKEGQVIAKLDPATYEAIVLQSDGDLASAKASLELAELTARRKGELVREHAASQADLDAAQATLHQAQATVQIKQGALKRAQVDLNHCTIFSPINGIVISRNVDVGQTVAASLSAPTLFTIANDMTSMLISAAVAEADIGMVAEKQRADFTVDAFPYTPFTGIVQQIRNSPVTVQNVVTYEVLIEVANPDLKLKPGMTANVSTIVAQRKDVVRIPNAALRFRPPELTSEPAPPKTSTPQAKPARGVRPGRKVYVLKPGSQNPEPVNVKLGITDNLTTEVLEGLAVGEVLVTALKNPPPPTSKPAANPLGGPQIRTR